jgi:DNA invertase Pin-like site-specific DNA recombinase
MMSNIVPIPAAQYLRMSTEDQQYSIANQRIRIRNMPKAMASLS